MSAPAWSYRLLLHGNVEHECRVTMQDEHLLWQADPVDEFDEDGERSSCLQAIADFREFGPPESPEFLKAPPTTMDAICAAAGASEAPWRKPLAPDVAAFFQTAGRGDMDRLRELLQSGVSIHARDHHRRTALWHAAEARTTEASEWLLDAGADVNAQDRYGRTVLMNAAFLNREALADLYRLRGADRSVRDQAGRTAWLIGIEAKAGGTLLFPLRACAKEDWPLALHIAARVSNIAWMEGEEWFLENGSPEMNWREGRFHRTPLQACVRGWRPLPQAVRWLIENGADLTVVDEDDGTTMLHHAAKLNLPWMVAACVSAGVDVNARDQAGKTAIDYAMKKDGNARLLRALLEAGADASHVKPEQQRALLPPAPQQVHSLYRTWQWQARDWAGRHDKFTLVLRRGILKWKACDTEMEQSVERFRIEGPPRGAEFYRTLPQAVLEEICEAIGDAERPWELPCSKKEREARVQQWLAAQPAIVPNAPPPAPPAHKLGKWCYAQVDVEDHFTSPSGAGGDGEWTCWMEFPAEWCGCNRTHLEQWLTSALKSAYDVMNQKASGPDGGHYTLRGCWPEVMSRAEALKQPWAERGKVLYAIAAHGQPPRAVPDDERRREATAMGDPDKAS